MPEKLRLGLVGSGGWAGDFLVPAILSHEAAALTAVCGRTRERAVPLAARSGAAVYTDYQEMIDNAGLDAVVVATPEDLHHPVVMAALAAGLHVLCEKPLAYTAEQSGEMLAAADRAGVKHMVQFTNRGLPHYRYVKQLLDDGYIGRPYHASFSWATGWGPAAEVNPYHWPSDAHRSTGAVGELGAHIFDLARWYFGEVVRVSATLQDVRAPRRSRRAADGDRERLGVRAARLRQRRPRHRAPRVAEHRRSGSASERPGGRSCVAVKAPSRRGAIPGRNRRCRRSSASAAARPPRRP